MKRYIILLFSVVIFNCDKSDDTINSSEYSEYITKNAIDTNVDFMPFETYSNSSTPQAPILQLKLMSTEIYPCINFILSTTQFINGNELIIRFDNIDISDICFTAFGPAVSYIDLPENTDHITLLNGSKIDKYAVEINQEKVNMTLIERNFTNSLYEKTFRYPENSFAYVCGTNTNNTEIYTDFLNILKQNPNLKAFNFEGEGRIPYPEIPNGYWVNHPSQYFTYSDNAAYEALKGTLHDYAIEHIEKNSGVSIALYGWNNLMHYSWIHE